MTILQAAASRKIISNTFSTCACKVMLARVSILLAEGILIITLKMAYLRIIDASLMVCAHA